MWFNWITPYKLEKAMDRPDKWRKFAFYAILVLGIAGGTLLVAYLVN